MREDIPSEQLNYVGKDIGRVDAVEKITGKAIYTGDILLPGMLYAKVKHSPHAFAKIKKINTKKAEKLPGVHAILTGKDLPYRVGLYLVDKFILARDVVRHYGEAVAAVAAESPAIAQQAVDLIEVEYDVLTPALDPKDAIKKNAPLIHPDLKNYSYFKPAFSPQPGTNIANLTKLRKGNVEKGFKEADIIVEREYTNPNVQHVPLETHVSIGQWLAGDQVNIWTSAQSPFTVRNLFCHSFGLPRHKVRVIVPTVGGGFGGKAGIALEPLVCCLSKKAGGRPVKMQATREEEFSLLPCRTGLVYKIKTGIKKNGKIISQKMTLYWDSGAYADYAVNITRAAGYSAAGPYEIPNAWIDSYTVYTNKPFGTAYRGFGHVEFSWGLERHMNLCAEKLKIDPLKFRKMNALKPGSITLTGEVIKENTGNVTKCMEAVAKNINYGKLTSAEKAREKKTGMTIGKAVVALHKAPAMPPFTATAVVLKMTEDGNISANLSLTEIGQGAYTALTQIIAEESGFPVEKIKITIDTDTDKEPYDWQTVASKGLILTGNASCLAVQDLLKKAYVLAAQILRCDVIDLDHTDEEIFIKHHPEESVSFASLAVGHMYPDGKGIGGPLIGVGTYMAQGLTNLDKETGQGLPALDWTYGAHGVIVEVNEKTGEFNLIKISCAFDVGKVINPKTVRGQVIGGVIQGLGTAMCEGYIYDENGILLNPSFTDNKIFTAMDVPEEIQGIAVETPQIDGAYGARGVGEHPMIAVCAGVGNAIYNACGADLTHMPIRAEDVWRALNKKGPAPKAKKIKKGKMCKV